MRIPSDVHQLSYHRTGVGRSLEVGAVIVGPKSAGNDGQRSVVVVEVVEDDLVDCLVLSIGGGDGRPGLEVCRDGKVRAGIGVRHGRSGIAPHGLTHRRLRTCHLCFGQELGAGVRRRNNGRGGGGEGSRSKVGRSNLPRVTELDPPVTLSGGGRESVRLDDGERAGVLRVGMAEILVKNNLPPYLLRGNVGSLSDVM